MNGKRRIDRRGFLKSMVVAGVAPSLIPARVLGAKGRTPPSGKITLGVIGVGAQGRQDMGNFLAFDDVRVTAICRTSTTQCPSSCR